MDNLTHSLIGLALGHAVARRRPHQRAATICGIIASNLPDIDLVARPFFEDAKLGYLVHHRGHTHTLPVALAMIPLAVWLACALDRRPWSGLDRGARRDLGLVAALGLGLHVGADAWNNYGVHPFWPLWSDWLYGDAIFIIEPLLLAALLPYAVASAQSRPARLGWGAALLFVIGLALWAPGVPLASGLLTAALAGGLLLLQRGGARLGLGAAVAGAVLVCFFAASSLAEARVRALLAREHPGEAVIDVMTTPTPATPLCWSFIAQTRPEPARRRLLEGGLSLAPELLDPAACQLRAAVARTAPLAPRGSTDPAFALDGELLLDEGELARAAARDCRVRAFLRFGRAPFWVQRPDALVLGDLRYDFEPEPSWAELTLASAEGWSDCGPYLASWIPDSVKELEAGLPSP